MFPKITNQKLAATKNKNILLKTNKKTTITQSGACTGETEHKILKKCTDFCSSQNGQALLGIPDTDVLNLIKINIPSICAQQTGGSDNCCANMHTV